MTNESKDNESVEKMSENIINVRLAVPTEVHEKIDAYRKRLVRKRGGNFVTMSEAYVEFLRTRL